MTKKGRIPDFIIIGALKSGTTSLHYYLSQHPEVFMSRVKELRFFYDKGNWNRGFDWYKGHFRVQQTICGEATPQYTDYPFVREVPARVANLLTDAKLIYLVRDPVQRIISHYIQLIYAGKEKRSLSEALRDYEHSRLVTPSLYAFQLSRCLRYYHSRQILVVRSSELMYEPVSTLSNIFSFLGIRSDFRSDRFQKAKHVTASNRMLRPTGHKIRRGIARLIGSWHSGLTWRIQRVLTRPFSLLPPHKTELDVGLRNELVADIRSDAKKLAVLTGIDNSDWMQEMPDLPRTTEKPGRAKHGS